MNRMHGKSSALPIGLIGFAVVVIIVIWFLAAWQPAPAPATEGTTPTTPAKTTTKITSVSLPTKVTTAPEVKTSSGVVSTAESLSSASKFAGLLSSTGVSSLITGKGPFTIFIPINTAYGWGATANMTAAQRKRMVEYHVVIGRAVDPDAIVAGSVTALSKDPINFQVLADQSVRINSAAIIKTYKASNGIVYLINSVLLPPLQ